MCEDPCSLQACLFCSSVRANRVDQAFPLGCFEWGGGGGADVWSVGELAFLRTAPGDPVRTLNGGVGRHPSLGVHVHVVVMWCSVSGDWTLSIPPDLVPVMGAGHQFRVRHELGAEVVGSLSLQEQVCVL